MDEGALENATREEIMSALFLNMVMQNSNMALMLLGKIPQPDTGEKVKDIEAAKMFIDQLEMIEAKTRGNLDKREEQLLKQSLTMLRMAFVEAFEERDEPAASPQPSTASAAPTSSEKGTTPSTAGEPGPAPSAEETESRKKFSKKY